MSGSRGTTAVANAPNESNLSVTEAAAYTKLRPPPSTKRARSDSDHQDPLVTGSKRHLSSSSRRDNSSYRNRSGASLGREAQTQPAKHFRPQGIANSLNGSTQQMISDQEPSHDLYKQQTMESSNAELVGIWLNYASWFDRTDPLSSDFQPLLPFLDDSDWLDNFCLPPVGNLSFNNFSTDTLHSYGSPESLSQAPEQPLDSSKAEAHRKVQAKVHPQHRHYTQQQYTQSHSMSPSNRTTDILGPFPVPPVEFPQDILPNTPIDSSPGLDIAPGYSLTDPLLENSWAIYTRQQAVT